MTATSKQAGLRKEGDELLCMNTQSGAYEKFEVVSKRNYAASVQKV